VHHLAVPTRAGRPVAGSCLVTGGSGFVGRPLVRRLERDGHAVTVVALEAEPGQRTVVADLSAGPVDLGSERYREVYHLAGLAHLEPHGEAQRARFVAVNLGGTRALLDSLERCSELPESLLLVSTVAVYGREAGTLLDEDTPRRASDPYGASKRDAEDLVLAWGEEHGVRTAIARLPLVAGPNAPGNLKRMVVAIAAGRYLGVGPGSARRSMVWVDDVAAILPRMARSGGVYHLTDGRHPTFAELERRLAAALGRRPPWRVPLPLARLLAMAGDVVEMVSGRRAPFNRRALSKMTSSLTFSDERARQQLAWAPGQVLDRIGELVAGDHSRR